MLNPISLLELLRNDNLRSGALFSSSFSESQTISARCAASSFFTHSNSLDTLEARQVSHKLKEGFFVTFERSTLSCCMHTSRRRKNLGGVLRVTIERCKIDVRGSKSLGNSAGIQLFRWLHAEETCQGICQFSADTLELSFSDNVPAGIEFFRRCPCWH